MRGKRKRDGFAVRIRLLFCPNPAGHSRRLNTGHPIFSKTVSYFLQSLFWMFIEVSLGRANGRFPVRLCSCKTCPRVPPSLRDHSNYTSFLEASQLTTDTQAGHNFACGPATSSNPRCPVQHKEGTCAHQGPQQAFRCLSLGRHF